nr:hypothetical protein CFP56_69564 [Quercus suber]
MRELSGWTCRRRRSEMSTRTSRPRPVKRLGVALSRDQSLRLAEVLTVQHAARTFTMSHKPTLLFDCFSIDCHSDPELRRPQRGAASPVAKSSARHHSSRAMAALNGVATLPATAVEDGSMASLDGFAAKRKRNENDNAQLDTGGWTRQQQAQQDILAVLRQHDTKPSFLEHEFDNDHGMRLLAKKPKLLESANKMTSLLRKLQDGAYPSLQFLMEDVTYVKQQMVKSSQAKETQSDSARMSVEDLKQIQRVTAFEGLVQEIVQNESKLQVTREAEHEKATEPIQSENPSRIGTVLTLFGNAPTPKQLFSSMQHALSGSDNPNRKTKLPIEEMNLPNGLTATKIITPTVDQSKKEVTFEEVFAPPYNLAPLNPPRTHKRSSTRDNTIVWEFKDVVGRGGKKNGYTAQTVTVGDWLSYGGKGTSRSSMEKQKQRGRALSSGQSNIANAHHDSEEDLAREEEALFRRAYSSFAPSYDNAKALVPEETKSMLWWQKIGQPRYNELFAIDPALLEELPSAEEPSQQILSTTEADDFASVVEELDGLDKELDDVKQVHSKTDVDQVLNDIAELLGKLASHQRIRNSSLPSSTSVPRPPISPAPILHPRSGKTDEPGDEELATFRALKRELCYLVLQLPPYAVSKLDGQQFAALGVGKLITFQPNNIKGTMEEDQVARLAKYNSMATAAGIAALTRGTSSTSAQHYNTTAQRTPAIGQAANTRYGTTGTPAAQSQYQRSTSHQPQYGTPASKYGPAAQYTKYRATGPSQQPSYQSAAQQYYRPQATPGGYGGYGQQYNHQGTPQTQQPTYSSQSLAQYQQRSQAAAYKNSTQAQSQNPFPRTVSPAKPDSGSQYQQPLTQRPTYPAQPPQYSHQQQSQPQPGSGRATPVYATSQPHTPVNGFSQPPPQQQRTMPQAVAPRPVSTTPQPPAKSHP